jgi:adenine specific DNA methylase Mod
MSSIQGISNFKEDFMWQKKEKPHLEDLGLEGLTHVEWIIAQSVQ